MRLYSSTFLSIILAFFIFLGAQGELVVSNNNDIETPLFTTIIKPLFESVDELSKPQKPKKITIEIFNAFGCPACSDFALNTLPLLREKYSNNENIELLIRLVPAPDDEGEYFAVVGAKCAGEQDLFWEMHDELHKTTELLSKREADLTAQGIGVDILPYRSCVDSKKYDEEIGTVIAYAQEKGITKKPTVLINGYKLIGNQPIENIEKIINEIINY